MKTKAKWFVTILTVALAFSMIGSTVAAADFSGYDKVTYESPISPTKKGMQHVGKTWFYEYSIDYENEFFPMVETKEGDKIYHDTAVQSDGVPTVEKANVCNPWGETLFLLPGNIQAEKSANAVQTFQVPNDGHVVISPSKVWRHYGYEDIGRPANQDVEVAIFVNNKKVWPAGDKWESVNNTLAVPNTLPVPELDLGQLKKGDRVRFVVGCGNMQYYQWEDHTTWEVVVNVYTPSATTKPAPTTTTTTKAAPTATTTIPADDVTVTDGDDTTTTPADDVTVTDSDDTTTTLADDAEDDATTGANDDKTNKAPVWPWIVGGIAVIAAAAIAVYLILKSKKK